MRDIEKTLVIEEQRLNKNFTQIPNEVLFYDKISVQARLLYAILVSFAWFEDECFPGQARLAAAMGCKERAIRKYLAELREHNLIEWKRREGAVGLTNVYFIRPIPREVIEHYHANALLRHVGTGVVRHVCAGVDRHARAGEEYSVMKNTSIVSINRNTPSGCEGVHPPKKDEPFFENDSSTAEKLESSESFREEDEVSEQETFSSEYENGTVPQTSTNFQPEKAGLPNKEGRLFGYEIFSSGKERGHPSPHVPPAPLPSTEERGDGEAGGATWRDSLNRWEKEVVEAYEYFSRNRFREQELPLLKEALAICPPSGIVAGIARQANPERAHSFAYFMKAIKRGAFGRRCKKTAQKQKTSQNVADEAEWEKRFERLRARTKDEN